MLTVLRHIKREYWLSELRLATGRSLIRHLLTVLNRPVVFMPRYVPEGVRGPCYDAGCVVNYYNLNPDLTPDIECIRRNLYNKPLVIVIHYFGLQSPTHEIRKIVSDAEGVLFEDCAQTLYDDVSKAHDADVALWSLNKFMPLTDGAILRSRNRNIDISRRYHQRPDSVGFLHAMKRYSAHLDINVEIAKTTSELATACLLDNSNAAYEDYYEHIGNDYAPYEQTEESKLVESQFDIEKEKAIRATNAWRMSMILPNLRGQGLPQFAFPLMCKSLEHREIVAEKLLHLGILASRQDDKWNFMCPKGTLEKDFIDRHLLLPLGDPMDIELIGQIGGAL